MTDETTREDLGHDSAGEDAHIDGVTSDGSSDGELDASSSPTNGGGDPGDEDAAEGAEASGESPEDGEPEPPKRPPEDPRDRRIRELHQMVERKDELLRDYIKAHKQAQAEWETYKQRVKRDREDEIVAARGKVVERLLTVADNMERSLQASRVSDSLQSLQEGMELVYKGFSQALSDLGLVRIDPTGQTFDPSSMEALGVVGVSDPAQDNTVVQCMQAGFALGEKELRPALVQVGKYTG